MIHIFKSQSPQSRCNNYQLFLSLVWRYITCHVNKQSMEPKQYFYLRERCALLQTTVRYQLLARYKIFWSFLVFEPPSPYDSHAFQKRFQRQIKSNLNLRNLKNHSTRCSTLCIQQACIATYYSKRNWQRTSKPNIISLTRWSPFLFFVQWKFHNYTLHIHVNTINRSAHGISMRESVRRCAHDTTQCMIQEINCSNALW